MVSAAAKNEEPHCESPQLELRCSQVNLGSAEDDKAPVTYDSELQKSANEFDSQS